ncbi:unnamed protein product [Oreochromis niloticus]|nr:unnamed protein product [Mustela putorius furo]
MSQNRITNYQSLTPGGCVAEWGKTVRHMNRLVVYLGLQFKTMLPPHRHPAALFPQLLGVCQGTASGAYASFGCTSYRGLASYGHCEDTRSLIQHQLSSSLKTSSNTMLCSGLSSTLLLGAAYFLLTSGFSRAQLSLPSNVTAISTGRVITFNVLSVLQLSCGSGVMIVQSVLYRCADKEICSRLHDLDVIKKSCDLKEVCEINTNMVRTCDPSVCTYLDITFKCFPAIHSVTCEGSQAKLQCGEGQVIVVSWANFGRRDNTTCPDGNTAQLQNVTCLSPNSPEYVTNRCNWQNSCTVEAKTSVFGDPCGGTYKYLEVVYDCQKSEATSSPPPTTVTEAGSSKTCPPGWTWFGGRCFIFNSSQKIWTDAESSCETLGGHLASFHSTAEYTFIRGLTHTAAGSYKEAWVGGRKNETVWMWSDGSQFDFINWASGEPNNSGGGEDCMMINHGERDYVNDKKCNTNIPFVCVRDP